MTRFVVVLLSLLLPGVALAQEAAPEVVRCETEDGFLLEGDLWVRDWLEGCGPSR
jgi:hypothetical protein